MHVIKHRRDRAVVQLHEGIGSDSAARLIGALRSAHNDYFWHRVEISIRSDGGSIAALREILEEIGRLRARALR